MHPPTPRSRLVLGAGVLLLLLGCGGDGAVSCEEFACEQGTCAMRDEGPVCLCGGQSCSTFPTELDRMRSEATPLATMSSPAEGNTAGGPPAAYFSFSGQAHHKYSFGCGPRSIATCKLRLFDAQGVLIGESEANEDFYILFRAPSRQTYYLAISSWRDQAGSFEYLFLDLGYDDHGDFFDPTTPVQFVDQRGTVRGNHEALGDRDVFSFQAVAGHEYGVLCHATIGAPDLTATISSGDGQVLHWATLDAQDVLRFKYRTLSTQTLYLSVGAGIRNEKTGSYSCELSEDEDGDSAETARTLASDTDTPGRFDASDEDFLTLSVQEGHFYRVSCVAEQGSCAVARDAQSALGAGVPLAFKAQSAATVLFRFTGTDGTRYVVRAEDLGLDDHGDDATGATALTAPASLQGSLQLATDRDVFTFPGVENHIYRVSCDATAGEQGWHIQVVDPRGYDRAWDAGTTGAASTLTYEAEENTTYSIVVASPSSGRTGSYACRLEYLGVDDYGDNQHDPSPVAFPSTFGVNIESWIEADSFYFDAPAGHLLRIRCTSSIGQACKLEAESLGGYPLTRAATESGELQVTHATASRWLLRLTAPLGEIGQYTLSLDDLGPVPVGAAPGAG